MRRGSYKKTPKKKSNDGLISINISGNKNTPQTLYSNSLRGLLRLLPLDCGRRLTRDVINDTVDVPHLIDDTV